MKKIAIQGEPGSNSHLATRQLLGEVELVPCALSVEVLEKLARSREADAAVLPVENSLHGAVADHSDLLLRYGVQIVAECSLRIRHTLMAIPGVAEGQVKRVLSHPVALSQCRKFFMEHPALEAVPFYDTAGAVKHLMANHVTDAAAIAAPFAAKVYGAATLRSGLEDDPKNFTRFFLLARAEDAERLRPEAAVINKISLAFDLPHRPGSLLEALKELVTAGADLTRIDSRPVPGRPWEYTFFVDLRIPSADAADALVAGLRQSCREVVELGRYEAAGLPLE
ncbi:prephenate dehydratase [Terriglobus sp. RCC_193]|uniref:prephenate dehydratase n=1 Tax=Terriglobus sp. RCC_193 TaxID=3239218 RepID=UPI0035240CC1